MSDRDSVFPMTDAVRCDTADQAVTRLGELYDRAAGQIRERFGAFVAGDRAAWAMAPCYPYIGMAVPPENLTADARLAYGVVFEAGLYGTTITRPDIFSGYYREQLALVIERHRVPVYVGVSTRPIPLPFVLENATTGINEATLRALADRFVLPDLVRIDDAIANGRHQPGPGKPRPLALFEAERVDYSLVRLHHYTGTSPGHFQRFILLTNYQRYVDAFRALGERAVAEDPEMTFIGPGDVVTRHLDGGVMVAGTTPQHLPQMPAYHLARGDKLGVSLVNIGVGPSNAKTITDHLAVLRPHCWIMLGHCAGLRRGLFLGDYVLAHGYLRDDQVLDRDLPREIPVPAIAEVQVGLQEAVAAITGLAGTDLKTRLRTGTVYTTDDRNWELRLADLYGQLNQARAIAVDMESATVAANGFRFRVPYGTLLCVSDKPVHGELKLRGMANALYDERVGQHLAVGVEAMRRLRDGGLEKLHSRKLRSFDEPAFR